MPILQFSYDTKTVPLGEIVDAFCGQCGYQDFIDGKPNLETRAQFARRMVKEYIINIVNNYRQQVTIAQALSATEKLDII